MSVSKASCHSPLVVNKKFSEGSACCATTSRGLSPSSGDHDTSESYSFCSGNCSCNSRQLCFAEICEKPCIIIDSSTRLRKSKWSVFKNFIKCRVVNKTLIKKKGKKKLKPSDGSNQKIVPKETSDSHGNTKP